MPTIVVSCPKCRKRHELPTETAVPAEGLRLRCSECNTGFRVRPKAPAEPRDQTLAGLGPQAAPVPAPGLAHAAPAAELVPGPAAAPPPGQAPEPRATRTPGPVRASAPAAARTVPLDLPTPVGSRRPGGEDAPDDFEPTRQMTGLSDLPTPAGGDLPTPKEAAAGAHDEGLRLEDLLVIPRETTPPPVPVAEAAPAMSPSADDLSPPGGLDLLSPLPPTRAVPSAELLANYAVAAVEEARATDAEAGALRAPPLPAELLAPRIHTEPTRAVGPPPSLSLDDGISLGGALVGSDSALGDWMPPAAPQAHAPFGLEDAIEAFGPGPLSPLPDRRDATVGLALATDGGAAAAAGPAMALDFLPGAPAAGSPGDDFFGLDLQLPPASTAPPPGGQPALLDLGPDLASGDTPSGNPGLLSLDLDVLTGLAPPPAATGAAGVAVPGPADEATTTDLLSLDFLTGGDGARASALPPPSPAPDGLGLELDGPPSAPSAGGDAAAPAAARPAEALPALQRPKPRGLQPPQPLDDDLVVAPPRSRRKLVIFGAAGAALALVAMMTLGRLGNGPVPERVLKELAPALAQDDYVAYGRAIDALAGLQADQPARARLDGAAAELALIAALGHGGDRGKVARAEQLLAQIPEEIAKEATTLRARALLAIAKGKGHEAEAALGAFAGAPESRLVIGLAKLVGGKGEAAAVFEEVAQARPNDVLPLFLVARAKEARDPATAGGAYEKVLARNPGHFGARLARLRLAKDPPVKRLETARALAAEGTGKASPGEQATVWLLAGQQAAALGETNEAVTVLGRAATLEAPPGAATIALSEALLDAGRAPEALQKLQAMGASATKTPAGKFALGGALIVNGRGAQGLALVQEAVRERRDDPRGPFWAAVAAEAGPPPDAVAAEKGYRAALEKSPAHLPAALRLAALMQRLGRSDEAIAVLRAAETAGAPQGALRLAWGEALLAGNKAAEAEQVFRKAIADQPKLAAAHAALTSALEAQGKLGEARDALEKALAANADATGLRERLADLLLRLGKKDEALAQLKAERAAGKASARARVKLVDLAIELGQLTLAGTEAEAIVGEDAGTPGALFALGRLREAQGRTSQAVQDYRRALNYESSSALQLALGRALAKLGREEDAAAAFEAAGPVPAALVEKGKIRLKKGDLERALADFQEASRLAPEDPEPLVLQGSCLDQMGQVDRAAALWTKAIQLRPEMVEAQYHLGRYKMDKGKPADALANLRLAAARLRDKAPWEQDLYFQLGFAELAAGSRASGAAAFKKYLALAPQDAPARPEVERQLAKLSR